MGKQWKQWQILFLGNCKITKDDDCNHEIKRCFLLVRKSMANLYILKTETLFRQQSPSSQNYGFSSSQVWIESWTIKNNEHRRIDVFELWCWRRLLRVSWTARRSNESILKEVSPEYSLERLMLKLKLQYFGHQMQRTDSFKRSWCWESLKAGGEGDERGWAGRMASPTQWTWVWVSSGSWRWTGRPGACSPWRHRIGHDWAIESNLTEIITLTLLNKTFVDCFWYLMFLFDILLQKTKV